MIPCLEAAKGHLQCLETMRIDTMGGTSYYVEHIFESAPRLQKVSLGQQLMWNGLSGSWAQLVELNIGHASYTVGSCLALLQSMKNLQKLRICIESGVVAGHHRFVLSHPLVSLCIRGIRVHGMLFDHITLPSLQDLDVYKIDEGWPQSQFISFLERSSPPIQSFSFGLPMEVDDLWDNNVIQILEHIPSLHSLRVVYNWCEVGSFIFKRLAPRILDNGQVDCLIPKLHTISIQLGSQLVTADYTDLKEMVISRCSPARGTNAGDNISGPIEQIWKVEVECFYQEGWGGVDGVTWHAEVSEILAPLQEVVDTLQVVIY
jgi:hypothetical protein